MQLRVIGILLVLLTATNSAEIGLTGQLDITTSPYQAGIIIPKVDGSFCALSINTIKYSNNLMGLKTKIQKQSLSSKEEKLVIQAILTQPVGLVYTLALQYLVIVEFEGYEFASINMTATSTYSSRKQLVFQATGSVQPYVFINGFSTALMTTCCQIYGTAGTYVYDIVMSCGTAGTDWLSFTLMLTKSPLIEACPNSIIEYRSSVTSNWTTQKQPDFMYFYSIQGIYVDGKLGKTHLDRNVFEVETGGDFEMGLMSIDMLCFNKAKYPGLAAWQIALIAVGSVLFVVLVGLGAYFIWRYKKEKELAVANKDTNSYEMSGAALGIPASTTPLNPMTVHVGRRTLPEIIPEDKVEWTKEELDEKFGAS